MAPDKGKKDGPRNSAGDLFGMVIRDPKSKVVGDLPGDKKVTAAESRDQCCFPTLICVKRHGGHPIND